MTPGVSARTLFAVFLLLLAAGCATPSQSPEERHREARIRARERGWPSPTPLYAETPRPTSKPGPSPTPRPVLGRFDDAIDGSERRTLEDLLSKVGAFHDTFAVGLQTQRIALVTVVLKLQDQRREFMAVAVPDDFLTAQRTGASAMGFDIDTLTKFMGQNETGSIVAEVFASGTWDEWTNEFNRAVDTRRASRRTPTPARPKRGSD